MPVSTARRGAVALLLAVLILFVLGSIEIARGATDAVIAENAAARAWPASAFIATGLLLLGGAGLLVIVRRPRA